MLLLCTTANAARGETLNEAVLAALNHHPSVQAAMANRDAYIAERREQSANYFPELSIGAAGGRIFGDNSTTRGLTVTRGSAYSNYGEGSISLTQMLFDGFEVSNKVEAAQARRESANYNIVDIREDLALRTVLSYLGVLRAREALAKIDKHMVSIKDYRARIERMVEGGAADESQAALAHDLQIQLEKTRSNVAAQLKSVIAEYQELTGFDMAESLSLPEPRLDMIQDNAQKAVDWALKNHPALVAASLSGQAVSHEIDVERAAYYPDFTGELSYLKSDKAEELGGEIEDAKALVRMNWRFSTGGGTAARISKSKARYNESRAQYKEMARQIEREVKVAYSDMKKLEAQKDLLLHRKTIHEELLANYESQFEGALVTLLQMMQTHNKLFMAELELLNGDYSYLAAQYSLLASMGRLQESLNVVRTER